jgi:hypothetical protein
MTKSMKTVVFALALSAVTLTVASTASADDWPLAGGDYWSVTGIKIHDGGGYKYTKWLATEWKKDAEFAKSKGWIKDYKILSNEYARANEPDLYLVRIHESVVSAAESEKRSDEYQEWNKKSIEALESESGNRAEFREVMGSELLMELHFKD